MLNPLLVVYNVPANSSLSILLGDLGHNVSFFKKVLHETFAYIKEVNPTITKNYYFLDGFTPQYKICRHFFNLCHHENDFSDDCVWNFFATSHGNSPCHGIDGTVKRLTAQTCLQRSVTDQILSAKDTTKFHEGVI